MYCICLAIFQLFAGSRRSLLFKRKLCILFHCLSYQLMLSWRLTMRFVSIKEIGLCTQDIVTDLLD
jgi:hypothetical protein